MFVIEQLQVAFINRHCSSQDYENVSIAGLGSADFSKNRPGGDIWQRATFSLHLLTFELVLHLRLWLDDTKELPSSNPAAPGDVRACLSFLLWRGASKK